MHRVVIPIVLSLIRHCLLALSKSYSTMRYQKGARERKQYTLREVCSSKSASMKMPQKPVAPVRNTRVPFACCDEGEISAGS